MLVVVFNVGACGRCNFDVMILDMHPELRAFARAAVAADAVAVLADVSSTSASADSNSTPLPDAETSDTALISASSSTTPSAAAFSIPTTTVAIDPTVASAVTMADSPHASPPLREDGSVSQAGEHTVRDTLCLLR